MNNLYQQSRLANFAPDQSLDKYSKGTDPRVINGIVALSEMQDRAAERARANMASGAAPGQMPTVRDKIMQMFQQGNQPPQQPQQQPNPMLQRGIMTQANPQMQTAPMPEMPEPPPEAPPQAPPQQMYNGGVARLPVSDRMFGYANGGIISFRTGERPEDKEGYEGPTDADVQAQLNRLDQEAGVTRDENGRPVRRAAPAPAPKEEATSTAGDVGRGIMSAAGAVGDWWSGLSRQREMNRERMAQAPGFFEELTPSQRAARMARMKELGQQIDNTPLMSPTSPAAPTAAAPTAAPAPAPARDAQQEDLAKLHALAIANGSSAMSPSRVGIAQPPAPPKAAPPGPTPPKAPPSAAGTGIDAALQQQRQSLMAQNTGPQLPEPDMVEGGLKYLAAQNKYIKDTPDSEAAKQLQSMYKNAAARAAADDAANIAQQKADSENNLWSFLSNTRGSSLSRAAGRANEDIQGRLGEQKRTNAEYRKYSYERDMNREKASAEAAMAEEARKRGDFGKAIEHEQKERTYRLEAKKANDTAQHYKNTETNQLLNIEASRESSREGHLTQLEVARINKAAQLAGYNKPSEAERIGTEYRRIRAEQGEKAANAYLQDEERIRASVGGVKYEGPDKSIQNRAKVHEILGKNETYNTQQGVIARLEAKPKLTPKDQAKLDAARKYVQNEFNKLHKDLYGTDPSAGGSGAAPQRVTTQEEYAKLPSGTTFIAPDGSTRTKP